MWTALFTQVPQQHAAAILANPYNGETQPEITAWPEAAFQGFAAGRREALSQIAGAGAGLYDVELRGDGESTSFVVRLHPQAERPAASHPTSGGGG